MSAVHDSQILFIACNENFCSAKIKLSSECATNLTVFTLSQSGQPQLMEGTTRVKLTIG